MTTNRSALTRRLLEGLTDEEWHVVRTARANVLFIGRRLSAKRVVEALRSQVSDPIHVWRPGARLVLPPAEQAGTFVLQELGAMTHDDQRHLHDWLQVTSGRTRVISTARQPMLPLLQAGTFIDTLYYRLNILCFQVSRTPTKGARPSPRRIARRAPESEGHNAIRWKVAQERLVLGRVGRLEIKFCFNSEWTGDYALGIICRTAREVLNQGNLKDDRPDRVRAGI